MSLPAVAVQPCSRCGTARKGWFRYCLKCGFDFEVRSAEGPRSTATIRDDGGLPDSSPPAGSQPAVRLLSRIAAKRLDPAPTILPDLDMPTAPVAEVNPPPAEAPSDAEVNDEPRSLVPIATAPPLMVPTACPYLGLVDDPATHFMFPAEAHRCQAGPKPWKVDEPHQVSLCLSEGFRGCPRFPASD